MTRKSRYGEDIKVEINGFKDFLELVEKDKLEVKILRVLVTVQKMVIRNYSAYYDLSTELDYVKSFVENAERIGLMYVAEGVTLTEFKDSYNLL